MTNNIECNSSPRDRIFLLPIALLLVLSFAQSAYGALVSFQAGTGHWLSAEDGGGGEIVADRGAILGGWEKFFLTDVNDGYLQSYDMIHLQAYNGKYFWADAGGGGDLGAVADVAQGWETFYIIKATGSGRIYSGDAVYLMSANGHYMSALNGGGGLVNVGASTPLGWETFYITIDGGGNYQNYGFQVLVDVNTLSTTDTGHSGFVKFANTSDGVWAVFGNSPGVNWTTALNILRGNNYIIVEQLYHDYVFADPTDWRQRMRSSPLEADHVVNYLGHRPDHVMLYHEPLVDDPSSAHAYRYPYGALLCGDSSNAAGDQITVAKNIINDKIVAMDRAYSDSASRLAGINKALANPNCKGFTFEVNPPVAITPVYGIATGINAVLNSGRKCYLLFTPGTDPYLSDVTACLQYLRDAGVQLSSTNFYFVLARYGSSVSFVGNGSTDPNTNDNSVLAASQWLKRFKNRSVN